MGIVKRIYLGIIIILFLIIALYFSLYFLVPWLGPIIANEQLYKYFKEPATVEAMQFNPVYLQFDIFGVKIGENASLLILDRASVDLEWDSIVEKKIHIKSLELEKLKVDAQLQPDGSLNLVNAINLPQENINEIQDISSINNISNNHIETEQDIHESSNFEPIAVILDNVKLIDSDIAFMDIANGAHIRYDDVDISIENLHATTEGTANVQLSAKNTAGHHIISNAKLDLVPSIKASGNLDIQALPLQQFWGYASSLPLLLNKGNLSINSDYNIDLSKSTSINLDNSKVAIRNADLTDRNNNKLATLPFLEASDIAFNLDTQSVFLGSISSNALEVWVERDHNGNINWQQLFTENNNRADTVANNEPTSAKQPPQTDATKHASAPWDIALSVLNFTDYKINFQDKTTIPVSNINISPLNLGIKGFELDKAKPFGIALSAVIDNSSRLNISGTTQITPDINAKLNVKTHNLDLRIIEPYIEPFVNMNIATALINTDINVDLPNVEPLMLNVSGDISLNDFKLLDSAQQNIVNFNAITINGINYAHEKELEIQTIQIDRLGAAFKINADNSNNFTEILKTSSSNDQDANKKQETSDSKQNPNTGNTNESDSIPIRINKIEVHNSDLNYTDRSNTPMFATNLNHFTATINDIDTKSNKLTTISARGLLDNAPIVASGSLNANNPLSSLKIKTSLNRLEVSRLSPYTSKYIGYTLGRGQMSVDVNYAIKNGKLQATNRVILDKLELGSKTYSKDAPNLPLGLALSLLRDNSGKINIDLPIAGDLNNPKFSILPIVLETFKNLIIKTAAAPFKLITGLLDTNNNLDGVNFASGSYELTESIMNILDKITSVMKEKTDLKLEITGAASTMIDGYYFSNQRLESEYKSTQYNLLKRSGNMPQATDISKIVIKESDRSRIISSIYVRYIGESDIDIQNMPTQQKFLTMREELLAFFLMHDDELYELATKRADAIYNYLLSKGMPRKQLNNLEPIFNNGQSGDFVNIKLSLTTK